MYDSFVRIFVLGLKNSFRGHTVRNVHKLRKVYFIILVIKSSLKF